MFWRFGGYSNVSTIDTLLEKSDVTLEELLDESDLIQELKQHNTKLIEYIREPQTIEKLLAYVVAAKPGPSSLEDASESLKEKDVVQQTSSEGDEDEAEKKRIRYAYVSSEVLSSDIWSICEALMEHEDLIRRFWRFLELPAPLDPLQASYFTKVNETLLDKKTWEMLELFKSMDGIVKHMLKHVDSPMVMDLLLKIISLEKVDGGQGIIEWLHSQNLMPILLDFLSPEHSWSTQTSAGDFLKAIITISANASQNEQSCIGPNDLTRQLVSKPCVEKLIADMLKGGNPLTVGVGIVIEVIRKNNSDYDPDVGGEASAVPTSRDPIYLGTLLRLFADHVPDFMNLILCPPVKDGQQKALNAAFGEKIEPLGFDRFKTCELMAELLHCSNMGLLNELGSEEFIKDRDLEREKLRSEGRLNGYSENHMMSVDDLTMKSPLQNRLASPSPDEHRRLEVQNASDDDGFEEVTHANDLPDDKDFEKPLEDEFTDEPLSTPPHQSADTVSRPLDDLEEITIMPLSPSKRASADLASPTLSNHIESINTQSTKPGGEPESPIATEAHQDELSDEITKLTMGAGALDIDIPEAEKPSPMDIDEKIPANDPFPWKNAPIPASENPADKPAPLFSDKQEEKDQGAPTADETEVPEAPAPPESGAAHPTEVVAKSESLDPEASKPAAPLTPVVGDYLKTQFVKYKVVPTILDFFFRFPWNNFLHNVVYDVVQQVFNGPMDRGFNRSLAIDLFEEGDISKKIVDGQKRSDTAQQQQKMRLGYMGHLTLIAEEVVKFTERHPPELLSEEVLQKAMDGEWIQYVEVTLAETRERDNAILGGVRPDVGMGPRQAVMNAVNSGGGFGSGSAALAEAGLNGSAALAEAGLNGSAGLDNMDLSNGSGNSGGFSLSHSLLSGLSNSSDEEDEDLDDDNEDPTRSNTAAEFSRYITTPSTTTGTSSQEFEPPSASPPPPPLNIPPSRARRQLAAQLALRSKQNAEDSTLNGGAAKADEAERRKNLNPFAADEDEDDDDENDDFTIGDMDVEDGHGHMLSRHGLDDLGPNSSDEDSDDGYGSSSGLGRPRRRLSATTAAKRRTSLDDEEPLDVDEPDVVNITHEPLYTEAETNEKDVPTFAEPTSMSDTSPRQGAVTTNATDDDELVEIKHTETHGATAVDAEKTN